MLEPFRRRAGAASLVLLAAVAAAVVAAPRGSAHGDAHCACADTGADGPEQRAVAAGRVNWRRGRPDGKQADPKSWVHLKLLGINDFHGQLSTGRKVGPRPVGGAAVLSSWLKDAAKGVEDRTFLVHAGDHVGASPAASALLQDEPSIAFLNLMNRSFPVVGTLGNHEFDEGRTELLRLLRGGNHPSGPFLEDPWHGADYPVVSANVVDAATGKPILAPYLIRKVQGIPIAFVGAVLEDTPTIVTPSGVAGLSFLDEADAINASVAEIRAQHVESIIVLIHQGGFQSSYTGNTTPAAGAVSGAITGIVDRLDGAVDVVVSGHTHAFTNAILKNHDGDEILVTQSFSAGTAFADIDLSLDPASKDVVEKSAAIVTTWGDTGPGLVLDPEVQPLVAAAEARVAPLVSRIVGESSAAMTRTGNAAGESVLGDFIADAQRSAMGTDFAFMNPGGIREDLNAGPVTWGELFTIQPFGNTLVKLTMTGAQVKALLEQQWQVLPAGRFLQISGLAYTWDAALPVGSRVVEIRKGGVPIAAGDVFTVTANNFIAGGGDGFTVFLQGTGQQGGPVDLDALVDYVSALPVPFAPPAGGRITRLH